MNKPSVTFSTPLISCVMLTADRPRLAGRAIRSFLTQTWPNKELIIFDTGKKSLPLRLIPNVGFYHAPPRTIGEMRNAAISRCSGNVIAHWDDDDVSAPTRLAEQYELLWASDAQIVGYSSMFFHRVKAKEWWLYHGDVEHAIGASLMYRRTTWENRRFPDLHIAEDMAFQLGRRVVTAYGHRPPRMIATQHGKNVSGESGRFIESTRCVQTDWSLVKNHSTIAELFKIASV